MDTTETIFYTVPIDVLMDIAEIIVKHQLQHQITDIKENANAILLKLTFSTYQDNAKKNVEQILNEYAGFMKEMEDSRKND